MITYNKNKELIEALVEELNDANHSYYVLNDPIMSDYDFDMKLKELERLENESNYILPYSPTQRIGSDLQKEFKNVDRTRVMGSIANVYVIDELKDWLDQFDPMSTSFLLDIISSFSPTKESCFHVRFSTSLIPRQISEAHGCLIVSNFIL